MRPDIQVMRDAVRTALEEDVGSGDITSQCTIPERALATGEILIKEDGIVAGLDVVAEVYKQIEARIALDRCVDDGHRASAGTVLATVAGPARGLLTAERTALNFLQRLSGIATLTWRYVQQIQGTGAAVLDTRKTTPGLRALEKYAVLIGGGHNHRLGLFDMVMIKDTHWRLIADLQEAIAACRKRNPGIFVEVEAGSLQQVSLALQAGADRIMLDNMGVDEMSTAVALIRGQRGGKRRVEIEASGGINLDNVRQVAETGVDYVSVGALTHSARALDIAFYVRSWQAGG